MPKSFWDVKTCFTIGGGFIWIIWSFYRMSTQGPGPKMQNKPYFFPTNIGFTNMGFTTFSPFGSVHYFSSIKHNLGLYWTEFTPSCFTLNRPRPCTGCWSPWGQWERLQQGQHGQQGQPQQKGQQRGKLQGQHQRKGRLRKQPGRSQGRRGRRGSGTVRRRRPGWRRTGPDIRVD